MPSSHTDRGADTSDERADTLRAKLDALRAQDAELAAAIARVRTDPDAEPAEVARLLRARADVQRTLQAYERLQAMLGRAFGSAEHAQHVDEGTGSRIFRPAPASAAIAMVDGGLYTPDGVYTGADQAIEVLFVNGILVEFDAFRQSLARIARMWPERVVAGVYNATDDVVRDVWQATNDRMQAWAAVRLDESNPAVRRMADVVFAVGASDRPHTLTLIGHSQGGAILSSALNVVARERPEMDLGFLQVYALGSFGVDFPPGPDYHIFVHQFDPVPVLAQMHLFPLGVRPDAQMRYFANLTVLRGPADPLEAHTLAGYLADWQTFVEEEHRVRQGNKLRQFLGQVGEVTQFQANPWSVLARLGDQIFGGFSSLPPF